MVSQTVQGEVLKDIAIGIVITSFLFAISIKLPVFGFFCSLFIPLPTLYYRSKLGRRTGSFIPALTIITLLVMFGGLSVDIFYFIKLLLIGFILSEFIELNLSIEKTILYTCSVALFSGLAAFLFYTSIAGIEIKSLASEYVAKNLEMTLELYKSMGMPEENIHTISSSLENIQYVLVRIMPALVTASTLFIVWTCLMLAKPLLKTKKLFYPDFGSLNLWKAPEYLVWVAICCGLLILIPNKTIKFIGINGIIIMMTIYFFQGIAIVSFYFEKKKFPRTLIFFLYSLIALQQALLLMVIGLGFFDMWLNFRKLEMKKS